MSIHPTAIIDPDAQLSEDIYIGPYAIIGADVVIGTQNRVDAHAIIKGHTILGENNHIHSYAYLGGDPQDQKYDGSPSTLRIGNNNIFREFSTIHRGSQDSQTCIGNDNLFMAYSHVAHDCLIGDRNILSNNATLGGHVHLEDQITLGGLCAIHQHCRIGNDAMIAGGAMVVQDVPPFTIAQGDRARLYGINRIGLRRRNISSSLIDELHLFYKMLFLQGYSRLNALAKAKQVAGISPETRHFLDFFSHSNRGICSAYQKK